jgi:pyruvate/2-oxoglutarate dehydrogenase complex dihydrolipoamide dehydrogenase (E3) component
MAERADVIVVGMGPGGEEVAGRLAQAGLDVVGIEQGLVGGECPYWGCIPSKMMLRAASLLAEARRIPGMAGTASVHPDWSPVARRIREEATDDWDDRVAVERFEGKGGRFVRGHGRLTGPGVVEVDGSRIEARKAIVVATGTSPALPPVPGLSDVPYWTNRDAVEAKELPASLVVLGGGAVGMELAQAYARFGVEVTVVEALDQVLPLEEPEASEVVTSVFRREGINVYTAARATKVDRDGERIGVVLHDGRAVVGERILVATGRRADLQTLGVGSIGVDEDAHAIAVDGHLRAAPGVWAVGDVTGVGAFTHIALYQAAIAVADILGQHPDPADYRALPRVTFTDPEVASVGLTEIEATRRGLQVRVGSAQVPRSARGWIHKAGNDGVIKLVEDAEAGVVVGATSVGPAGGEILGLLGLAVHARVPTSVLRGMIYAYPTFYRAVEDALADLAG